MSASGSPPNASVSVENPYAAPTSEAVPPAGAVSAIANLGAWSMREAWRVYWPPVIGCGVGIGLCVSIATVLSLQQPVIPSIVAIALGEGIVLGALLSAPLSIMMRPATFSVAVEEQAELLDRLDQQIRKLRYRPRSRAEVVWVYGPKPPFRLEAWVIRVQIAPALITVIGPRANVKSLRRRLSQG